MTLLLVAVVIIIAWRAYRLVKVSGGHDEYLMTHEWAMYVFDGAPMMVVQALFHFVYAGDIFGRGEAVKQDRLDEEYTALNTILLQLHENLNVHYMFAISSIPKRLFHQYL